MQAFTDTYCTCLVEGDRSKHIVETHVKDILVKTLQPVFQKQTQIHPTLSRRPEPKYRAAHESELHENQQWKENNYVDIMYWLVKEISSNDLKENLHLILPPVLIILDDYDIEYKEEGVKMVHYIVNKLDSEQTSRMGLDSLFFESLFSCLLRLSQDREEPLVKVAYPCILDLIASVKDQHKRSDLYERVLKDGIVTGYLYAGQKILFLPILLKPIVTLYNQLGSIGVQYLKAIIPMLCDSMAMISSNNRVIQGINLAATESLIVVIKKCWPRIPEYKGLIMKSIAKTWAYYHKNNDAKMCDTLKQLYKVFEAACQGQEKMDKEALLNYNTQVYEALFS
ncbi:hypothetical protein MFLAVUS_002500 [Mucor flavus]|uniref:Uncharacterized protein n=1 Tax=Mucor flavus TaxID=439312 RepID=A0ABP9YQF1_9FUNG